MQSLNDYKTVRWNVPLQSLVSFWTCAGSEGDKSLVPCFGLTDLFCCAGLHPQLPPWKQRSCSVTLLTVIHKVFFWFWFLWSDLGCSLYTTSMLQWSVNIQSIRRQTIHTASTRKQRTCSWKFSSICSISSSMSILWGSALTSFIVSLGIFLKWSEIGNGLLKSMVLICGEVRFKQLH